MSAIARDHLDDVPVTLYTIRTWLQQLRALLQRLELMQVMGNDNKIRGPRLEVTVQHVDTVQAVRRICSELDILRVQGLESLLEGMFDGSSISSTNLIQDFRVRVENLRLAMLGIANAAVPLIFVRATLTLPRHEIGWSGKNLDRQLRETKVWEQGDRKIRIRI